LVDLAPFQFESTTSTIEDHTTLGWATVKAKQPRILFTVGLAHKPKGLSHPSIGANVSQGLGMGNGKWYQATYGESVGRCSDGLVVCFDSSLDGVSDAYLIVMWRRR